MSTFWVLKIKPQMMSFSIKPTFVRRENMAIWFSFLNSTQSNWSWKYFDWRCWSNESVQILSQSFSILSQNVDWLIYTPSLKSTIHLNNSTVVRLFNFTQVARIERSPGPLFFYLREIFWGKFGLCGRSPREKILIFSEEKI